MACDRCKEDYPGDWIKHEYKLNGKTLTLCSYCLEHVKIHKRLIPPAVEYVKQRKYDNCGEILFPHEYFYYVQDWENINKSLGYFCECCVSKMDEESKKSVPEKKLIWTAVRVCDHAIPVK